MTDPVSLGLAALACALLAVATGFARRAARSVPWLRDVAPFTPDEPRPSVSVIAPALDEERQVEQAVRALLAQRHAPLELVLVDDRSTDATPRILARLACEFPTLRVETISVLPAGWLGKNHANWRGAQLARGDLLLFTDADVVMAPDAIGRAAAALVRGGWDHVTVAPRVTLPGVLLSQFTLYFGLLFSLYARPWAARDVRSRAHVGIGAFNLVRRDAYFAAGGHERLRMRPDDDMKLGKLLKRHGCRQLFMNGLGEIEVEWYASWREVRDGLMKNLFAGTGYSVAATVAGSLLHLALLAGPPIALLAGIGGSATMTLNAASCTLLLALGAVCAPAFGTRRWGGALLPAFAVFGTWLMWRSMLRTLWRGGIEWRGTHYRLDELRRNIV